MSSETLNALRSAGLQPPRILTLAITDGCNLNCSHCWVEARPRGAPTQVSSLTVRRLIGEFADLGGEGVRISGGEPLLHPDWLEFMEFALSIGLLRVELQTNGLLLGAAEIAGLVELAAPGLKLQISLDGARAATHDRVRGHGTFAAALGNIRRLVAAGLAKRISLCFTEMEHNLEEFPELLTLGEELGVGSVYSGSLITGGRAAEGGNVMPPTTEQYRSLLERFRGDVRFQDLYAAFGTMAALEWWTGDSPQRSCCSLIENPYLTPGGVLYPCLLCHNEAFAVGGAFERSLEDAFGEGVGRWSALHQLASRRAETIPACRGCPEKALCASGCIGRAWGSCGDLLATDDRCEVRRLVGQEKGKTGKNRP